MGGIADGADATAGGSEHRDGMTTSNHARIAAIGLVLGPLLFTLGDLLRRLVEPSGTPTATDITTAVGQHHGAWLAAGLLGTAAAFCLVPAMLGLIVAIAAGTAAGGRGARTTFVGATMVAVGAIASVGHAVAFYAPYALYAKANTGQATLEALDDASESYPLLIALIVLFIVGTMFGSIVLLVGLRRARRVPVWSPVAAVVFVACGSTGGVVPGVIGILAALAAFVPAVRALGPSAVAPATVRADERDRPLTSL